MVSHVKKTSLYHIWQKKRKNGRKLNPQMNFSLSPSFYPPPPLLSIGLPFVYYEWMNGKTGGEINPQPPPQNFSCTGSWAARAWPRQVKQDFFSCRCWPPSNHTSPIFLSASGRGKVNSIFFDFTHPWLWKEGEKNSPEVPLPLALLCYYYNMKSTWSHDKQVCPAMNDCPFLLPRPLFLVSPQIVDRGVRAPISFSLSSSLWNAPFSSSGLPGRKKMIKTTNPK